MNILNGIVQGTLRVFNKLIAKNIEADTVTATTFTGTLSGNASTATKVGTSTVGGTTTPIYLNGGTPTALSYTIAKSVPSDAKFTDTTYTSLKNPYSITIQGNGTTLTNGTYDGSAAKTVNITAASIGLGSVNNTADSAKSVKYATSAGSATSATSANSATKATQDSDGNAINTTYRKKSDGTTCVVSSSAPATDKIWIK